MSTEQDVGAILSRGVRATHIVDSHSGLRAIMCQRRCRFEVHCTRPCRRVESDETRRPGIFDWAVIHISVVNSE